MDEERLPAPLPPGGQILIYRDGATNLQVRLDGQTVWLTQATLVELFQTTPQNITLHLQSIYDEGELDETATCKEYLQVRQEGVRSVRRSLKHYNLDAILAVGYRVRSPRGTAFRQWATARLAELLVKGFTLDDERIKAGRTLGDDYFDELLAHIRDIRSSERLFYQKITDIYSTSIDYDPNAEITRQFFQIAVRAIGLFTSRCNFSTEKIRAIVGQAMPIRGTKKLIQHEGHGETIGFRVKADGGQGRAEN